MDFPENPDSNQPIGSISVQSERPSLVFSLLNQQPEGALDIDPSSGVLWVADPCLFDFESRTDIQVKVEVFNGLVRSEGQIVLRLTDVEEVPVIWDGPMLTFVKEENTDAGLAANQDRITDKVWISRPGDGGQIFNVKAERFPIRTNSPLGTRWAFGELNQLDSLQFKSFRETVDRPKDVPGKRMVLHLLQENIYLQVEFLSWSQNKTGGFSYMRSTL